MLYDEETLRGAVLRIYEYLSNQFIAEKRPHFYKPDKPVHRKALDGFVKNLPESAGFDFIWKFLSYQFYIYAGQNHERRPLLAWFVGKEALRRWREYDDGMKYHVEQWCVEKGLTNPVVENTYTKLGDDLFDEERMRMSRISGPNYCSLKVDGIPYMPGQGVCLDCPFDELCKELWYGVEEGCLQ